MVWQSIAMTSNVDRLLALGRARRALRDEPDLARVVRRRARLTQDEIATELGVDRSAVSRWESGTRMPRADVLTRYLDLLERVTGRAL